VNPLHIDISWAQLKALHQVYLEKRTKSALFTNPYLERLRSEKRLLKYKTGNLNIIEATDRFYDFYRSNFLAVFQRYEQFFATTGVLSDGRRSYSLYDLETLIYIHEHKATLNAHLTTERSFSAQLFKGSKYLENNQSVLKAVLQIFDITSFPKCDPKEQQWRLVIDCTSPVCIVLCENLAALKFPDTSIGLSIELWYVGGNNTKILENLSSAKLTLPIYYMGDWDYDGLRIFQNVKNIMAAKRTEIRLLHPHDITARLPIDSPYHESKWKHHLPFSGLREADFSPKGIGLIKSLIKANEWLEEESQDFTTMIKFNKIV